MEGRSAGNERGEEDENEGGEMRWRERERSRGGDKKKKKERGHKSRGLWGKRDRQSTMVEKKQFGRRDGTCR